MVKINGYFRPWVSCFELAKNNLNDSKHVNMYFTYFGLENFKF